MISTEDRSAIIDDILSIYQHGPCFPSKSMLSHIVKDGEIIFTVQSHIYAQVSLTEEDLDRSIDTRSAEKIADCIKTSIDELSKKLNNVLYDYLRSAEEHNTGNDGL